MHDLLNNLWITFLWESLLINILTDATIGAAVYAINEDLSKSLYSDSPLKLFAVRRV